jgi:hypothetical protein
MDVVRLFTRNIHQAFLHAIHGMLVWWSFDFLTFLPTALPKQGPYLRDIKDGLPFSPNMRMILPEIQHTLELAHRRNWQGSTTGDSRAETAPCCHCLAGSIGILLGVCLSFAIAVLVHISWWVGEPSRKLDTTFVQNGAPSGLIQGDSEQMILITHRETLPSPSSRSPDRDILRGPCRLMVRVFWLLGAIGTPSMATEVSSQTVANDNDESNLAIGHWKVHLRSRDLEWIFPERVSSTPRASRQPWRPFFRRRRVILQDCHLSIFSNGTFAFWPLSPESSLSHEISGSKLPVHGTWEAPSNPYCATDRFYQALRLQSYQRFQHRIIFDGRSDSLEPGGKKNDCTDVFTEPQKQNQHFLVLHGHLQGHHSRHQAYITHGKILLVNRKDPTVRWWRCPPAPIVGSFKAFFQN